MKAVFKTIGLIILFLGIYLLMQGAATLAFILPAAFARGAAFTQESMLALSGQYINWIIIVSAAVSLFIYWLILRKNPNKYIVKKDFAWPGLAGFICLAAMGILLNLFTESWMSFIKVPVLPGQEQINQMLGQAVTGNVFMATLGVGVCAPIIEEVIFRGVVLNKLRMYMSVPLAVAIQALLFAVYYMNLQQGVYAFYMGILLGAVCYVTKSLTAAIILHIFVNSTSVMLSALVTADIGAPVYVTLLIVSAVGLALLIPAYWRMQKKRLAEPALSEAENVYRQ